MSNSSKRQLYLLGSGLLAMGVLSLLLWGVAHPVTAQATVRYVALGADCGTVTPCYGSIQTAVQAANAGDEIRVAAGTYTGAGLQVVLIEKRLTLRGGYQRSNWAVPTAVNGTIIDAGGVTGRRAMIVRNSGGQLVRLQNLTLKNGALSSGSGAGLLVDNSAISVDNLRILGNIRVGMGLVSGGGVAIVNSEATLRRLLVDENSGLEGGGIYVNPSSIVTLTHSVLRNNQAQEGGGLYVDGDFGRVHVQDNVMQSNSAVQGGGLFVVGGFGGALLIQKNEIRENDATGEGGGIYLDEADNLLLANNLLLNNRAIAGGGAYDASRTTAVLWRQNQIRHNEAFAFGGGIYFDFSFSRLENSIVRGNVAGLDGGGLYFLRVQNQMSGNQILQNEADFRGSAMVVRQPVEEQAISTLSAANDIIADNPSIAEAVFISNSDLAARHWTVANNGAAGIRTANGGSALISNSIVVTHSVVGLTGTAVLANHLLLSGNGLDCGGGAVCSNVVTGTAAFVAPERLDYRLHVTSAAHNAGANMGETADFEGEARPACNGYDLGADEYGGPYAVRDLRVSGVVTDGATVTATLRWTAVPGTTVYQLRYADEWVTDASWDEATILTETMQTTISATVLATGQPLFFGLRYSNLCGEAAVSNPAFYPRNDQFLPIISTRKAAP